MLLMLDWIQVEMVISTIQPCVVEMMCEHRGSYVVKACLLSFPSESKEFIYSAIFDHFVHVACNRHGCRVIQQCIDNTDSLHLGILVTRTSLHGRQLVSDPYGNYVLQHLIKKDASVATDIFQQMAGAIGELACQKCASHVIEMVFNKDPALFDAMNMVVGELAGLSADQLGAVVHSPMGNYVIQKALTAEGPHQHALAVAVAPHVASITESWRVVRYGRKLKKLVYQAAPAAECVSQPLDMHSFSELPEEYTAYRPAQCVEVAAVMTLPGKISAAMVGAPPPPPTSHHTVLAMLRNVAQEMWGDEQVVVNEFGSFALGLALPSSSLDVVLIFPEKEVIGLESAKDLLSLYGERLQEHADLLQREMILAVRMPLMKIVMASSNFPPISVDITIAVSGPQGHQGLHHVTVVKEYLTELTTLRSVILHCKQLLAVHDLNNSYTGGLSSYAVGLLAISFQTQVDYQQKEQFKKQYSADQPPNEVAFNMFLDYYGNQFDVATQSVVIPALNSQHSQDNRFASERQARASKQLFVADPDGRHQNASGCFKFPTIQRLFRDTLAVRCQAALA